jgi:hypothetical protein
MANKCLGALECFSAGCYHYDLFESCAHRARDRNGIRPWLDEDNLTEEGEIYISGCRDQATADIAIEVELYSLIISWGNSTTRVCRGSKFGNQAAQASQGVICQGL